MEDLTFDEMLATMEEFVASVHFTKPLPVNAPDPEPVLPDDPSVPTFKQAQTFFPA